MKAATAPTRILHKADYSGRALMDGLAAQVKIHPRITCLHNHSAIDLLTTHHHAKNSQYRYSVTQPLPGRLRAQCRDRRAETILADWTVLATGGVGQVFLHSTNAPGCVGAGISMAFRAGVELANLEFMQFHPTALYEERSYRRPLITEAMRGEGARLLDDRGEAFHAPPRQARATWPPRDVVAQAMVEEMLRRGVPCLYLDVSGVKQDLPTRFPTVFEQCLEIGIDIRKGAHPRGARGPLLLRRHPYRHLRPHVHARPVRHRRMRLHRPARSQPSGQHFPAGSRRLGPELRPASGAHHGLRPRSHPRALAAAIPDWRHEGNEHHDDPALVAQDWANIRNTMWNYVGISRSKGPPAPGV